MAIDGMAAGTYEDAVGEYAQAILRELKANEYKGEAYGWRNCSIRVLLDELRTHVIKLEGALYRADGTDEEMDEYAADVGALAMMVRDNYFNSGMVGREHRKAEQPTAPQRGQGREVSGE